MKFNVIILLMLLSIIKMSVAQTEQPYQPIIEPTQEELAKIGITLKGNFIIYDNDILNKFEFGHLLEKGYNNIPIDWKDSAYYKKYVGKINLTHFDFYPYYISSMDSSMGFTYMDTEKENRLKHDPLFKKKMFDYLVPVKIRTYGAKKKQGKYKLYWFTPTESFCRILSNYNIKRRYISDKDIKSDVALLLDDEVLKKIGFIFGKKEMFLSTYMNEPQAGVSDRVQIATWRNNKQGSGIMYEKDNMENGVNTREERDNYYYKKVAGYYVIKVVYLRNGATFIINSKYKGKVIPIYIDNSKRGYKEKQGAIIYFKYSEELTKLIWNWEGVKDIYTLELK